MEQQSWISVHVSLEPWPEAGALDLLDRKMLELGFSKFFEGSEVKSLPILPPAVYALAGGGQDLNVYAHSVLKDVKALKIAKYVKVIAVQVNGGAIAVG